MEENYNQEQNENNGKNSKNTNSNKVNLRKKKGWLWGCGGCLVLFILIIIGMSACTASMGGNIANNSSTNDSNATSQERAALNKAKIYSDTMHMSKQGIYNQLTSDAGEKFKEKDANYAIKHLKANYKENAKKKANDYVEQQNMSKDAVYNQLISDAGEKFTEEEAQYAVDHLDK